MVECADTLKNKKKFFLFLFKIWTWTKILEVFCSTIKLIRN